MEQLPQTDVIIVPIGGGGLIAGIAEAAKHIKPDVLIYVCTFLTTLSATLDRENWHA